jgi:hypothetical protein
MILIIKLIKQFVKLVAVWLKKDDPPMERMEFAPEKIMMGNL